MFMLARARTLLLSQRAQGLYCHPRRPGPSQALARPSWWLLPLFLGSVKTRRVGTWACMCVLREVCFERVGQILAQPVYPKASRIAVARDPICCVAKAGH